MKKKQQNSQKKSVKMNKFVEYKWDDAEIKIVKTKTNQIFEWKTRFYDERINETTTLTHQCQCESNRAILMWTVQKVKQIVANNNSETSEHFANKWADKIDLKSHTNQCKQQSIIISRWVKEKITSWKAKEKCCKENGRECISKGFAHYAYLTQQCAFKNK